MNSTTDKILRLELKKVKYIRSLGFVQGTSVNFLRTTILFLMLYLIFAQQITVGQFFSLWIYSFFIFGPLQELGGVINIYRETEVSLKNFGDILRMPPEPKPVSPKALTSIHTLGFDAVSFRHPSGASNAVTGISFDVRRGETIAFVGPSGAGKTTLVNCSSASIRPVTAGFSSTGFPGRRWIWTVSGKHIGFVTQDTQLFSGTIRENLQFVRQGATDQELLAVLDKAACQALMARGRMGLDTVIGEGGVKVSGGEKQRLSIARALLREPDLLVFDEATSSLDSLTEEEISETIRAVSRHREMISILIAHRLSTVMHADRIYVLERGNDRGSRPASGVAGSERALFRHVAATGGRRGSSASRSNVTQDSQAYSG